MSDYMKWILIPWVFLFTVSFPAVHLKASSFPVGHIRLKATDPDRGNRKITLDIYYPATREGNRTPMAESDRKIPVVSFGHGFMLSAESYRQMADWLVPEGFVVVFPLKERGLHPSHAMLAEDLAFAVRQLSRWGTETNSLFYNRIDSEGYVMGHSMGGGSAVLAAASHPEIKGLVLFAPFNTEPSAIEAAKQVTAPVLIFTGSHDCVTPPDSHQVPIYEALDSHDKTLISITGGTHCGMTAPDVLCTLGELTCRSGKGLDRDQQHAILRRYLLPWLRSRMNGGGTDPDLMLKMLRKDEQVTYLNSTF